jgi:hypothetical protein
MRFQAWVVRLVVLLVLVAVGVLGLSASAFAETPAPTATKMELSGGGQKGADITVPKGTEVTETVTVKGENVANVSGMVFLELSFGTSPGSCVQDDEGSYNLAVYSNPFSKALNITGRGNYYFEALYTGNSANAPSEAPCGSAILTIPASAHCTGDGGTIKLSPGLTNTPAVQTMTTKGTLSGCTGEPFTAVAYTATLKTAAPVSCSVLKAAGESASGATQYKWTPKAKASHGMLSMLMTETPSVPLSGEVTSGPYSPLTFSGTASEKYTGGTTCGEKVGKKAAKAVTKGTFTGSAVNMPACAVKDATTGDSYTTLPAAVAAAGSGDTLDVQGTCEGDTTITKNLKIDGTSQAVLNGAKTGTVLKIEPGSTVEVSGVTITGGTGSEDGFGNLVVGVGVVNNGTTTLNNSTVTVNTANAAGGLFNGPGGSLTLNGSTVTNNTATDYREGGGGNGGGIDDFEGTLTLNNSNVAGDEAEANRGGGVEDYEGAFELAGSSSITNNKGDGIYNEGGTETVAAGWSGTITGNTPENCHPASPCP